MLAAAAFESQVGPSPMCIFTTNPQAFVCLTHNLPNLLPMQASASNAVAQEHMEHKDALNVAQIKALTRAHGTTDLVALADMVAEKQAAKDAAYGAIAQSLEDTGAVSEESTSALEIAEAVLAAYKDALKQKQAAAGGSKFSVAVSADAEAKVADLKAQTDALKSLVEDGKTFDAAADVEAAAQAIKDCELNVFGSSACDDDTKAKLEADLKTKDAAFKEAQQTELMLATAQRQEAEAAGIAAQAETDLNAKLASTGSSEELDAQISNDEATLEGAKTAAAEAETRLKGITDKPKAEQTETDALLKLVLAQKLAAANTQVEVLESRLVAAKNAKSQGTKDKEEASANADKLGKDAAAALKRTDGDVTQLVVKTELGNDLASTAKQIDAVQSLINDCLSPVKAHCTTATYEAHTVRIGRLNKLHDAFLAREVATLQLELKISNSEAKAADTKRRGDLSAATDLASVYAVLASDKSMQQSVTSQLDRIKGKVDLNSLDEETYAKDLNVLLALQQAEIEEQLQMVIIRIGDVNTEVSRLGAAGGGKVSP